jgi:hypothetical protein
MVRLYDTVDKKFREAPINSIALWKCNPEQSADDISRFRETDYADLAYPMEAILGVAIDPKDDNNNPLPLSADYVRVLPKDRYFFRLNGGAIMSQPGILSVLSRRQVSFLYSLLHDLILIYSYIFGGPYSFLALFHFSFSRIYIQFYFFE